MRLSGELRVVRLMVSCETRMIESPLGALISIGSQVAAAAPWSTSNTPLSVAALEFLKCSCFEPDVAATASSAASMRNCTQLLQCTRSHPCDLHPVPVCHDEEGHLLRYLALGSQTPRQRER